MVTSESVNLKLEQCSILYTMVCNILWEHFFAFQNTNFKQGVRLPYVTINLNMESQPILMNLYYNRNVGKIVHGVFKLRLLKVVQGGK